MSIKDPKDFFQKKATEVAETMIVAAKTAPKACGLDFLSYLILDGEDICVLGAEMEKISIENDVVFFARDAKNIKNSAAVVLIGTSYAPRKVRNCKNCGFGCDHKPDFVPCAVASVDLGVAIGSAVAIASNFHIDNRIMFSAGVAAKKLKLFNENIMTIYAIPLSISEKNIFFDRG